MSEVIHYLEDSKLLYKLFRRFHYRGDIEDAVQELYLAWLTNPEGAMRAYKGGYLAQYATVAVRNRTAKYFYQKREAFLEELNIEV